MLSEEEKAHIIEKVQFENAIKKELWKISQFDDVILISMFQNNKKLIPLRRRLCPNCDYQRHRMVTSDE